MMDQRYSDMTDEEDAPREYTVDEVREMFLDHVAMMVHYWDRVKPNDGSHTQRDRLEGLAFSIMAALDGDAMELPGFIVAPCPHPDDKAFNRDEGTNWFPENDDDAVVAQIAGGLHELLWRNGRHRSTS